MSSSGKAEDSDALVWERSVPLLSDPMIAWGTVRLFLLAAGISAALVSVVFAAQGQFDAIGLIWLAFSGVGVGLAVLGLLVMLLVFGNRLHCRIRIDRQGIVFATVDRRARVGNRMLLLLGLLRGSVQATGAGLIATTQEQRSLRWRGAFRAEYLPHRHQVVLRNRWRRLLVVYATPENYPEVAARIAAEIERHGSASRIPERSPLPRYLGWTGILVIACLPLFAAAEAFDLSLMFPLLQLCFGLATIWLIGLFGWVLLATDVAIVGALLMGALTTHESWIHRGQHYTAWTVYDNSDWMQLALILMAVAVIAWIGWRGVRGRLPALLVADFGDSGE